MIALFGLSVDYISCVLNYTQSLARSLIKLNSKRSVLNIIENSTSKGVIIVKFETHCGAERIIQYEYILIM